MATKISPANITSTPAIFGPCGASFKTAMPRRAPREAEGTERLRLIGSLPEAGAVNAVDEDWGRRVDDEVWDEERDKVSVIRGA